MAYETKFVLAADEAKAVQAFLKVVDAQKKAETGFDRVKKSGSGAMDVIEGVGSKLVGMAAGALTIQGVNRLLESMDRVAEKAGDSISTMNRDMRGLLAQGDNQLKAGQLREQIINLGAAFGVSRKDAADLKEMMENGLPEAGDELHDAMTRDTIQLSKVFGNDARADAGLMIRTWQLFKDQIKDAGDAAGKVAFLLDNAYGVDKLDDLLVRVGAPAQKLKLSFDEVGAALVTVSTIGGRLGKGGSNLSGIFEGMVKAEEQGVKLTGNLVEKLTQLRAMGPDMMKSLGFNDEAVMLVGQLANRVDLMQKNLDQMHNAGPTLRNKINQQLTDPVTMSANIIDKQKAGAEAAREGKSLTPEMRQVAEEYASRDVGVELTTSPYARELGAAWLKKKADSTLQYFTGASLNYEKGGIQDLIQRLRSTGQDAEADYIALKYGKYSGADMLVARKGDWSEDEQNILSRDITMATREEQANEYGKLKAGGFGRLNLPGYLSYRSRENINPGSGRGVLNLYADKPDLSDLAPIMKGWGQDAAAKLTAAADRMFSAARKMFPVRAFTVSPRPQGN